MDSIYLHGSEDVQRAGNRIANAADDFNRAANNIEESNERQRRFMDEWLQRFEAILIARTQPEDSS